MHGWEGQAPNRDRAFELLKQACNGEHEADAQLVLGLALLEEAKTEQALACFRRSGTELGDRDALYHLAMCLPEQQQEEKLAALEGAAALDQPDALYTIAQGWREQGTDSADAMFRFMLSKAAEFGHVEAAFVVADAQFHGTLGFEQDSKAAMEWYQRSAKAGHADGAYMLGAMHYNGIAVAPDPVKAFRWYLVAAKQGSVDGLSSLGSMYWNGEGVEQNQELAIDILKRVQEFDRDVNTDDNP